MIEIIKAAFSAGEVKTFLIQGEYVEILESAYPVDVAMMDRSGAQLSTMRNAEASYFSRPGKYEVIQVTSPKAQTVRLFVGSGDAGTRRTSGDVSVIDGGKNRSIAGATFCGALYSVANAAGFSTVQIWNPVGSGKNVIVESYSFSTTVTSGIRMGHSTVQHPYVQQATAKKGQSPSSVAALGATNLLVAVPVSFDYLGVFFAPAAVPQYPSLREPFVIQPGAGLTFQTDTMNVTLSANLEFIEETL